jgi:uncharacterized membrane protein
MSRDSARGEHGAGNCSGSWLARCRSLSARQRGKLVLIAAICVVVTYQLFAHRALAGGGGGSWVAMVPLLALALLAWRTPLRWPGALIAVGAGLWLWTRPGSTPGALLAMHAGVYLGLLWLFARTLRAGREPLVTGIARRVRGVLPPEVAGYTRRVTQAWCVFFACMAVASIVLFRFAPLPVWSLFANLLNPPLVAVMFVGEYLVRITRFRHLQHFPITAAARAFRAGGRNVPPS